MKKIFLGTLIMVFAMSGLSLYAAPSGEKGASAKAYEHASDQSVFNRTSDWFSTIGKSDEEKVRIKNERMASREAKRAEKEAKKKQKEAEKKMKETKEAAGKSAKEMKGKIGGNR